MFEQKKEKEFQPQGVIMEEGGGGGGAGGAPG